MGKGPPAEVGEVNRQAISRELRLRQLSFGCHCSVTQMGELGYADARKGSFGCRVAPGSR